MGVHVPCRRREIGDAGALRAAFERRAAWVEPLLAGHAGRNGGVPATGVIYNAGGNNYRCDACDDDYDDGNCPGARHDRGCKRTPAQVLHVEIRSVGPAAAMASSVGRDLLQ